MKRIRFNSTVVLGLATACAMSIAFSSIAGNKDRIGQAGGTQLLINPWAQSSGMAGANTASAIGLEAMNLNVAGLAFIRKTELSFVRTSWLMGSDISINAFGLAQRLGESGGVLGISVMAMNFGDIEITTVNQPEGGIGKFSPQFMNLGISYAKAFSQTIYGGVTLRTITEQIADASAGGMALDAGVRYVTGFNDRMKFGISLRNVGPKLRYGGDGFSHKVEIDEKQFTLNQRTDAFELPSLLNIGFSYDFYISPQTDSSGTDITDHRITTAGTFVANSFGKDQILIGLEYGFKSFLKVRAGYAHEEGITSVENRSTAYTGPTAGMSIELPLGKQTTFGLDYSYRASNPFQGTHSIGARINL